MSSEWCAVAAGTRPEKQPHLQLPYAEEAAGRGGFRKSRGPAAIRDHAVFHCVPTTEHAGGGRGYIYTQTPQSFRNVLIIYHFNFNYRFSKDFLCYFHSQTQLAIWMTDSLNAQKIV